jgi:SAM-dependent methyltransferase
MRSSPKRSVLEAEFDRFAAEYREQHAASIRLSGEATDYFAEYKIRDVAEVFDGIREAPERILDFGGGVGNSLPYMRRYFPKAEITLLDPSAASLDVAAKRFPGEATFRHFDGTRIPLEAGAFDLVFTACVFHHIPAAEHIALLREIGRVLSPDGRFFLFEHNPLNPLTRHAVNSCAFDENAVLIGARDMRRRFATAGLRAARTRHRIFFPHAFAGLRPLERALTWLPLGAQYSIEAVKSKA